MDCSHNNLSCAEKHSINDMQSMADFCHILFTKVLKECIQCPAALASNPPIVSAALVCASVVTWVYVSSVKPAE